MEGYIYCIRLPLSFSVVLDYTALRQQVVKVGITDNPARRLHEIMDVFKKLGIEESPLQDIKSTDPPETAIQKAKSSYNDCIIFIVKVTQQDIHAAEKKVRDFLTTSPLGDDFIESFKSHVVEEKRASLGDAGMREWILADNGLMSHLRMKFRFDQLYGPTRRTGLEQLSGQLHTGSGEEFFIQLCARCIEYYQGLQRGIKIPPEVVISFRPANFNHRISKNEEQMRIYVQNMKLKYQDGIYHV